MLAALRGVMFWKQKGSFRLIPVLPKNYRSICLHAIEIASEPCVVVDNDVVTDFSERGRLTQKGIRNCKNLEIRDRGVGIVGFHDHPSEMWINENYVGFANYCEHQGWLKIQGPAS
jgi:hypothetical protein